MNNGSKIKIPKNEANMSNKRLSKGFKYSANIQIATKLYIKLTSYIR